MLIGIASAVVLALGTGAVVAVAAKNSHASASKPSHALTITLAIHDNYQAGLLIGAGCDVSSAGSPYSDLAPGASVTVKDGSGKIVAATSLPKGIATSPTTNAINLTGCDWSMNVRVPDSAFYQIQVAQRGPVTFTETDLERSGWKAAMTIGQ